MVIVSHKAAVYDRVARAWLGRARARGCRMYCKTARSSRVCVWFVCGVTLKVMRISTPVCKL